MKYWNKTGKYDKLFDEIWNELVPASGESTSPVGELVRAFGRINYDMGNNGAGNIYEGWGDYGEDEWGDPIEREVEMVSFYESLFSRLVMPVGLVLVNKLKEETLYMVEHYSTFSYNKPPLGGEEWVIDQVGDALGDYIVKNELYERKVV